MTRLLARLFERFDVALLDELYDLVVPTITSHGGHANEYIGDGLLAVFGAPARLEDHAGAGDRGRRQHRPQR